MARLVGQLQPLPPRRDSVVRRRCRPRSPRDAGGAVPAGRWSAPDRIWITEESQRAALSELLAKRLSDPGAPNGIARFARWYAGSFNKWFDDAILVNLVAQGLVPS